MTDSAWGPPATPVTAETTAKKFVFKEANSSSKEIYTIYGAKGSGKTVLALGFPGTIAALSFDRKTVLSKNNFYSADIKIKVYDAIEFFDRDERLILNSAENTYDYIIFLLDNIAKDSPDWVVIDGVEILQKIAEFVMRKREGLRPYQGISNLNVWKVRNSILDEIHKRCVDAAKRGVIYTTYTDKLEIVDEGTVVVKKSIPRYNDTILWETDVVLFVENKFDEKNKISRIFLRCDSSKIDKAIKTGAYIDITEKKVLDVIKFDNR